MKILIASDIHGSYTATKAIQERMEAENASELILLGDIYNHGPRNPLPEEYAPLKVAELLNQIEHLTVIKGNCDSEVDEMISTFSFVESVVLIANEKHIFLTHGHKYNENTIPKGFNALFYGHFHIPFIKKSNGVLLANPGSAALPKAGTEKGYLLLTDNCLQLKNLKGVLLDEVSF